MTYDIFLMRVMHRTGLDDRSTAQQLTHYVVGELARCIRPELAAELGEHLPQPLAAELLENSAQGICDLDAIYHGVAEEFSVDLSFGLEVSQVIFQVFGESVGRDLREALHRELPQAWHGYFEPRQVSHSRSIRRSQGRRTLASGQPGSTRPLSEARPGHRNSISNFSR